MKSPVEQAEALLAPKIVVIERFWIRMKHTFGLCSYGQWSPRHNVWKRYNMPSGSIDRLDFYTQESYCVICSKLKIRKIKP